MSVPDDGGRFELPEEYEDWIIRLDIYPEGHFRAVCNIEIDDTKFTKYVKDNYGSKEISILARSLDGRTHRPESIEELEEESDLHYIRAALDSWITTWTGTEDENIMSVSDTWDSYEALEKAVEDMAPSRLDGKSRALQEAEERLSSWPEN